jgi:hypothetical protein
MVSTTTTCMWSATNRPRMLSSCGSRGRSHQSFLMPLNFHYIREAQASSSTIGASGRRTNVSHCRFPRRAVPASTIVLSRHGVSWSELFEELKTHLVPIVRAICEQPAADDSSLRQTFATAQLDFARHVAERLGSGRQQIFDDDFLNNNVRRLAPRPRSANSKTALKKERRRK